MHKLDACKYSDVCLHASVACTGLTGGGCTLYILLDCEIIAKPKTSQGQTTSEIVTIKIKEK